MDMTVQSATQDVTAMLQDAIMAVQAAGASSREAAGKIVEQASHPELKQLLQQGAAHSDAWRERLSKAAQLVGGDGQPAAPGNPILDAIQQVGGKIIHKAADPTARDLGIIASGQLALHYYIAAFGTMAAYATTLGMPDVARAIHDCLQEAKLGDERFSGLAAKIGT